MRLFGYLILTIGSCWLIVGVIVPLIVEALFFFRVGTPTGSLSIGRLLVGLVVGGLLAAWGRNLVAREKPRK